MELILDVIKYAPEALVAALAIIGGLKVFARYTKWTWDDKALEQAEKWAKLLLSFFKKKATKAEEELKK